MIGNPPEMHQRSSVTNFSSRVYLDLKRIIGSAKSNLTHYRNTSLLRA